MPDTEVLDQLQQSMETTGTAIKSIGERLDKADKSLGEQDNRFKAFSDQFKDATERLADVRKSLDEHIEKTREALKAIPSVHTGSRISRDPYNTRGDGSGFEFSSIDACKAFGLYAMARASHEEGVRRAAMKALEDQKNLPYYGEAFKSMEALLANKAMGTNVFAAGGAAVPEVLLADLIRNVEQYGRFAVNAGRIPMAAPTVTLPKRLTGLTVYYPDENVDITESEPTLGDVTLNARLYATLTKWSNTLHEDIAVEFGGWLAEEIAHAHAYAVDLNGFRGDGTSTYARVTGIFNNSDVVTHILGNAVGASLTNTGKDTFGELAYTDLTAAQGLLPTKARRNAKWYCHRYVAAVMRGLVDTNGRPIFAQDYVNGKRVTRILGDELVEIDVGPSTSAAKTDFILYGDLKLAMGYGERRSLTIANSQEAGFAADQTWIRSTARRAIAALDGSQMVKLRTSTT